MEFDWFSEPSPSDSSAPCLLEPCHELQATNLILDYINVMQLSNLFHGSKLSFQVKHQIPQRPTLIAPGTYPSVSQPVGKAAPTHCLETEGIQKRY